MDWPENGELTVEGLNKQPEDAFLLSDQNRNPVRVSRKDEVIIIDVSDRNPDPVDSVVALDIMRKLD